MDARLRRIYNASYHDARYLAYVRRLQALLGARVDFRLAETPVFFEPDLVENPIEPWGRAMERRDFDAPGVLKAARFAGNVVKSTRGMARMARRPTLSS